MQAAGTLTIAAAAELDLAAATVAGATRDTYAVAELDLTAAIVADDAPAAAPVTGGEDGYIIAAQMARQRQEEQAQVRNPARLTAPRIVKTASAPAVFPVTILTVVDGDVTEPDLPWDDIADLLAVALV